MVLRGMASISPMPSLAIRLRAVVKHYGDIRAVDGLDLDVPEGTCVGLLGPNGAGKSTTMKMLTAQAIADSGELEVLGYTLPRDSKQSRAEMGVTPQLDNLDTTLTVEQNLLVFTYLYRLPRSERKPAIERARDQQAPAHAARQGVDLRVAAVGEVGDLQRARSCTGRACCCSTSRRSDSIRRCARSCGR